MTRFLTIFLLVFNIVMTLIFYTKIRVAEESNAAAVLHLEDMIFTPFSASDWKRYEKCVRRNGRIICGNEA